MNLLKDIETRGFDKEFVFKASRSSGSGGQNVNKVSSKVELRFKISDSNVLSDEEKILILNKLAGNLTNDGELIIVSQKERTQLKNKQICIEKFYRLIARALTKRKSRIPSEPTALSKEKRIELKRLVSEKKILRKKPQQ